MAESQPQRNKRLNRRRTPKRTTKVVCYGNPLGLGPNIGVSVLDVSETGVRLIVKAPLKVGQMVEMTLESMTRQVTKLEAECIWIVPIEGEKFCAGFHFEKSIDWGAFLALAST